MSERDIRKEVTDRIVAALERGVLPWRRPWRVGGTVVGLPENAVTGRSYNGGNRLILMDAGMSAGYQDNRWLTFKQAQSLGGSVRKGEHGSVIEYWENVPFWKRKGVGMEYEGRPVKMGTWPKTDRPKTVTLADGREVDTQDVTVSFEGKRYTWRQAEQFLSTIISRTHTVFNVEQCRDLEIQPAKGRIVDQDYGRATNIVRGMENDGVALRHGSDRAFYNVARDAIAMPPQEAFESKEKYLGTLLHELGHATGHPSRNNRNLLNTFGSIDYAKEELVAEMTSAFVAAETGIGFDDADHASYIDSWLEVLGKDKHEVFRAAKAASQAADYLIERGREFEQSIAAEKGKGVDKDVSSPETALREMWDRQGVPRERQDELIAAVAAKAAPGAQVGPFRVPERDGGLER